MKYLLTLCIFWAMIPTASSMWYNAEGSAPIINDDHAQARKAAAKDAIRQIMLQSGASFSSEQKISQGMLIKDRFIVRAHGDIQMTQLLAERIEERRMYVTLRAFIVNGNNSCHNAMYTKTLSLVRFHLRNIQDLSDGTLVGFQTSFSKRLFDALSRRERNIHTTTWLDYNLQIDPSKNNLDPNQHVQTVKTLASRTKSQYFVVGVIDDASIEYGKSLFHRLTKAPLRNLNIRVYLFDGLSGALLNVKHYNSQANWTFDPKLQISSSNARFWASPYGREAQHTIDRIIRDLDASLSCEIPKGKVIQVTPHTLRINIGKMHGLALGQQMFIQYQYHLNYPVGQPSILQEISPVAFEVAQIEKTTALLHPQGFMPNNIQVNDWALLDKSMQN